ncbi:flagellar basal body L-ring protein FlgH [Pseudoalteromonas sp. SMS1]|uniref:flagellar basal body L-ring protein FlgH n=1 Tax=Pseudoalteromonas sp. SMS1 TaxID=2908894 RepID=UPI001F27562D|nr:flagellar basal body L-ring protein FlgH [Pseudoalteromonas sp. SMS1]MCF2860217.1 flagellar basal body L-ring protein FlgH [Pseudoalteromonas sp. SMS1]
MRLSSKYSGFLIFVISLMSVNTQASSLFSKETFNSYTADKRASRVGDTVTIIVMENAQAKSSAGAATDKGFGLSASGSSPNGSWPFGIGVGSEINGDAAIHRNGFIKAQITALVEGKDANGNLIIRGRQNITLDGEVQSIEVTGRVRNSDISSQNTLLSSRLFDANIVFIGQGSVSEGTEPGVIAKLFKWLGLS